MSSERWLLAACVAALLGTLLIGARWPLVGDSILMHYVVFLSRHGFAPYRDIAEMNLPLTYVSEQAAMTVFGTGAPGWRLYDGALLVTLALLCSWLLRQLGPTPGVFAAAVFAAVHLQDGIHMAGQRDLLVTVLEAGAGGALLQSFGRNFDLPGSRGSTDAAKGSLHASLWASLSECLGTAAACIKPPAMLFMLAVLLWRLWREGTRSNRLVISVAAILGALVPLVGSVLYLQHFDALAAFQQDLHGLIAYHASLERRPLTFLLGHAWSPVLPLLLVTAASLAFARLRASWTRTDTLCGIGIASGLLSYLVQGKGFPYQRYPLLLWLLLLCCSRLWAVLRQTRTLPRSRRLVLYAPVAVGLTLIAVFLVRSTRFSCADPYAQLRRDLTVQGAASLNGAVQCLDTAGPCIGALYTQHLAQSTGFLYDCYLLDAGKPVVQGQRALLQREWAAHPPELVVLTDSNCFTGPRTFNKFASWPWMQQQLASYRTVLERHPTEPLHLWSRLEQPYSYRILRRP